jgi:cyclomaltodextrinase
MDWLDYAVQLGASGIALGPIFASETHGYDTIDYFRIDPRLGDEADFVELVEAAHARGLRILLDGVFNHVGRGFAPFQRALAAGPAAPETKWFIPAPPLQDSPELQFQNFEGHSSLIVLNHDEPDVATFVTEVMSYWLALGADGWRLDAAYAVPPAFWATVLPVVRAAHPDAYFAGEVIHGDYSAIVTESKIDTVTQYEAWKAIWSSISDANFFELDWALDRHNAYLDSFTPLTFIGNHDVTRIASALEDSRHLPHALVVLLTMGGTPSIYYGDEQGYTGVKEQRVGGDDAIRPEFPAEGPSGLSPHGWPAYRLHQELIGLRRRHAWLHKARTKSLHLTNTFYVYETRSEENSLVVALNLDDKPAEYTVDGLAGILAGTGTISGRVNTTVRIPAHGWAVLG